MMLIDGQFTGSTSAFYETKAFISVAAFYEHHSCVSDFIRVVSRSGQKLCHASHQQLRACRRYLTSSNCIFYVLPASLFIHEVSCSAVGANKTTLLVETFAREANRLKFDHTQI